MTVGEPAPTLTSFDDVLREGYVLHTYPGSFQYDLVARSKPGSALNKLYKTSFEATDWNDFVASQRESPTNKNVFFGSQLGDEILTQEFLHQKIFRDTITSQLGFAFQKNSEFRDLFNYHLIKITQSGMLKLLMSKWLLDRRPADYSGRIFLDDSMSLGYENLFFPMTIMMVGLAAALIIFMMELMLRGFLTSSSHHHQQQKWDGGSWH